MTRYYNTAEGGTAGTAVSTGNSGGTSGLAFSAVSAGSGGSIVYSNSSPITGALSYLCTPASGVANYLIWTLSTTATSQFAFRAHLNLTGYPSSATNWLDLGHATTGTSVKINLDTAGVLKVLTGSGNTYRGDVSAAIPLNTPVRIEVGVTIGTGTSGAVTVSVYNKSSGALVGTYTISGVDTNSQINRAIPGKFTASGTMSAYAWDDLAADDSSNAEIGPASTDYTNSPSESVGVTDSVIDQIDMARAVVDPLGVTDAAAAVRDMVRSVADPVGLADSVTAVLTVARSIADSVGITDTPSPQVLEVALPIDDLVGLSDAVAQVVTAVRTVGDSVGLTDSVSVVMTVAQSPADAVGLTDSAIDTLDAVRGPSDAAGISDVVSITVGLVRQVDDPVGITDSVSAVLTNANSAVINDAEGIADTVVSGLDAVRGPVDSAGISDTVTASLGFVRQADDPVGVTDAVGVTITSTRSADDVVGLIDSATAVLTSAGSVTVADAAGISDQVAAVVGFTRSASDALGIVDSVSAVLTFGIPPTPIGASLGIPYESRTLYIFPGGQAMSKIVNHDPDASLRYEWDWGVPDRLGRTWLQPGEVITSAVVTCADLSVTVGDPSWDGGRKVVASVAGGTSRRLTPVVCRITTSYDNTDKRTLWLAVKPR